MATAYCGRNATMTLDGNSLSAVYRVGLNFAGNETDITSFGSGEFGDWIICTKAGELTVETYDYIGTSASSFQITTGDKTFAGTCEPKTFNTGVDAKGVTTYRLTLTLTGDITAS